MSENYRNLVIPKANPFITMAKVQILSEKITPTNKIFKVMKQFDRRLELYLRSRPMDKEDMTNTSTFTSVTIPQKRFFV